MDEQSVMVSVVCLAYNHAKYIREALEGFVKQKTTFTYEVIVHDDASTDNTAEIIREYVEKYPHIIRPIFQSVNQYSQKVSIQREYTSHLVRGKYVALCEGDDYWSDPEKLQKQFETMECNPECSICTHKAQEIREDGTHTTVYHPNFEVYEGKITIQDFLKIQKNYPFHTASFFFKTDLWLAYVNAPPAFKRIADVGDEPLLLYMLSCGNMYYISDCMSVYRVLSIGSWSYKNKNNINRKILHAQKMYEMMCLYDEYTGFKYDCNIPLYRGYMLFLQKKFKELLKKENKPYIKQLPIYKKIYIYLCCIFPFMGKLLDVRHKKK